MEKALVVVPCISIGGLERVAVATAGVLAEKYDVTIIYFYKSEKELALPCRRLCADSPPSHNPIKQLFAVFKRNRFVKKYKRDNRVAVSVAVGWVASVTNILTKQGEVCVGSVHGAGDLPANPVKKAVYSALYRRADKVICVSRGLAEDFIKITGIKKAVYTLYNPADSEKIRRQARQKKVELPGSPSVFSHGRLVAGKNFRSVIRAFAVNFSRDEKARLYIMGDGPEKENLEKLAGELLPLKNFEFIPARENPYPYIARAYMYAGASLSEGFPVSLAETVALSVPAVVCDCKYGPGEILGYGTERPARQVNICPWGILTPSADPAGEDYRGNLEIFSRGIKRMRTDRELYLEYKEKLPRRARLFSEKAYKEKLLKILED